MKEHQLTVEDLLIAELAQHPDNANNGDVDAIVESIKVNGFYQPIIVQASSGYVIAGNHRLLAAIKSGAKTIPGIVLDVTDLEAKRMMVADNRITRLGHDDEGQLANILEELYATDAGLSGTGYDHHDYEYLMDLVNAPLGPEDFDLPEVDPGRTEIPTHRLNFTINPVVSEDGKVYELTLSRPGYSHVTANDINMLRKALGQEPYNRNQLESFGVPDWDRG